MYSSNELIWLAAFTGFSFWTCSFISDIVVAAFRAGTESLPAASKISWIYLSRGFASVLIFAGAMWLLVEVMDVPVYLFSDVTYTKVALLAIFVGAATTVTKVLFPNLFLQGQSEK
jgi:hypothetical protein